MNIKNEQMKLHEQRSALGLEKREHEVKLMGIKNLIRSGSRLSADKYKECCEAQKKHQEAILQVEKALAPIKNRLREIGEIEYQARNPVPPLHIEKALDEEEPHPATPGEIKTIVSELAKLRQHYQEFAADGTRVSSMRTMAAEFALKLDSIIKEAINLRRP